MPKRLAALSACSAGLAVALTAGAGAAAASSPHPAGVSRPGSRQVRIEVGGLVRTARVYVPEHVAEHPPVVLVLHGGFGTGTSAARQGNWDAAARAHRFVAVYPDGVARSWNAGGCCGPAMRRGVDDVGFLVALLDRVRHDEGTDPDRVFATGISNGGMMAYRLACEASDHVAAIAPVAATLVFDGCAPARPVSLLHIHGLADGNVPFAGGPPTKSFQVNPPTYGPVRDGVQRFARAAGCTAGPTSTTDSSARVITERWPGCAEGIDVELVTIAAGGHSWPGGHRMLRALDPPSDALDATETIWAFFAAHPRTGD